MPITADQPITRILTPAHV
ncbi:uncharacterized protein CELE_F44D12.16 [Caenorhabditis elegans]|uniref:Uncharacterized protein n=1 Tax=Caenorhabditis elegans TaxID=6239 RepID=D3KFT4_CAEEL|nr:Uncharacterized protein CELE_F44D12.16 [Caenorhabditis elegans]CBJ25074.1 Uncharacterized protein CELE_F44D12.16 [Caenorhabditis elegans]|eukprot:NP_001255455.1 Uncharacterized protein CELE_F44D12.16 [Caenorhabditis elegans]